MNVISKQQAAVMEAQTQLSYVDIGNNQAVYRLQRTIQPATDAKVPGMVKGMVQNSSREGIATLPSIEKFLKQGQGLSEVQGLSLVPESFPEMVARYGYVKGGEMAYEGLSQEAKDALARPFTQIVENGVGLERLLQQDYASHMVFDRAGVVQPTGVYFDYISARMSNAVYDLKRALEVLEKNDRVFFVEDSESRRRRSSTAPTSKIQSIPYYNVSKHSSSYLSFWFQPTAEEMQRMWEKQKSYGTQYPSTCQHQAMFDLDILGLRAAGAAYYEDFHGSREYDERFNQEDEDSDD